MDGASTIDNIRYTLHRARRRTISVEVRVSGAIIVRTPLRMTIAHVESFLLERLPWILKRLDHARKARIALPLPRPGEFYLRGELQSSKPASISKHYRNVAASYFPEVIQDVLPLLGVHGLRYTGLKLRTMHRRWGSCTGGGVVTLNDRLAMTPDHCIRAVVVHELCHLVHMNHGSSFRQMTLDIMPEIEQADADLDDWSAVMAHERGEKENGAQGPVDERTLVFGERGIKLGFSLQAQVQPSLTQMDAFVDYAPTGAASFEQSWSNEPVNADAIISGVRPSI